MLRSSCACTHLAPRPPTKRRCIGRSYEVRSGHTIALNFDAAGVSSVRISPELEGLIAPAILPRTPLQHMLLLAIKQVWLAGVGPV